MVMRLAEIEDVLTCGNVSDEILEQFKIALNKSPRAYRCQHCYTTAVSLDGRYFEQAIALIRYGLQFCDTWSDRMRAHYSMAIVYEKHKDHENALRCYHDALRAIPDEEKMPSYLPEFSAHMMRMELHRNGFAYTEDLRQYYAQSTQGTPFSRAFLRRAFYEAIAEIILFRQDGKEAAMKDAFDRAKAMLSTDYEGVLTPLLRSKKYEETIEVTEEVLTFLHGIGKMDLGFTSSIATERG